MSWIETLHPDQATLVDFLARELGQSIDRAIIQGGHAVLALAGGRTSPPIFCSLSKQTRDWSQLTLLPTDERWVKADHPDHNLSQMQAAFAGVAGIHWLSLVPAEPQGHADPLSAKTALAQVPERFTLTLLGMGPDGHFASLFPGAPNLAAAVAPDCPDAALAITPDPLPTSGPHSRISLSLKRLLNSERVLLVITGGDKLAVLRQAQAGADPQVLPVAALLHAPGTPVEIHWSP